MRRLWMSCFIAIGSTLVLGGLLLAANSGYRVIYAQNEEEAEYIGARECASCHRDLARTHEETRHAVALVETRRNEDAILASFDAGEDIRTVQFPGEDEPRPFTVDDIAYVIGSGRYVQRYLFELDNNEYAVFPAEWNTVTQEWQPYQLADEWPDPAYDWLTNCAGCHTTGLNPERGRWEDEGVQCEACHGPGSIHAELAGDAGRRPDDEQLREIRAAIVVSQDAQICGACHSQGLSPEDDRPYPVGYTPGAMLTDDRVFTLVPPIDTAHWWQTGHARSMNMQFNEWANSAHASALTTLQSSGDAENACLQCHSSDYRYTELLLAAATEGEREGDAPEPITLETAQFGVTCTTCHDPHLDEPTDFQLVGSPYEQCIQCHTDANVDFIHHPVQQMYEGQTIVEGIDGIASSHFTVEGGPDCVTCHMERVPVEDGTRANHALRIVLPGEAAAIDGLDAACTTCHSEQVDDAGMQQLIDDVQANTSARLETARAALTDGSPEWVMTVLAFIEGDGSMGIHNYAYTDALLDAVEAELGLEG